MVLESAPVDLRAMVESTVEMVAAEANKKGLALAYLLDEPLLSRRVLGDAIRIRQARAHAPGHAGVPILATRCTGAHAHPMHARPMGALRVGPYPNLSQAEALLTARGRPRARRASLQRLLLAICTHVRAS